MKAKQILLRGVLALCTLHFALCTCEAQGTAFTYQGMLNVGGIPASGSYDLQFQLFNALSGGASVGSPVTNLATAVSNGLFSVTLNFGAGVFNGSNYWVQIAARTNGGAIFTNLSPLLPITPTPYAIMAANANTAASANAVAATNITGTLPVGILPTAVVTNNQSGVNFSGTFSGNGAGLTNLSSANITGALSYVASQTVQRRLAAFVTGMAQAGFWSNVIVSDFFSPGQNSGGSSNLISLNNPGSLSASNPDGIAVNCIQTDTGLFMNGSNSTILYNKFPTQTGPVTLIVFSTGMGWNQAWSADLGCFVNPAGGFDGTGGYKFEYSTDGPLLAFSYAGAGLSATGVLSASYYSSDPDSIPRMSAFSSDGTNLSIWQNGDNGAERTNACYQTVTIASGNHVPLGVITLGSSYDGGTNYPHPWTGIIHGFIAISNYLSAAQLQQIYNLAVNTVLPWRRTVFDGDSIMVYESLSLPTNAAFWGNGDFVVPALGGSTVEDELNRFPNAVATNMPNGQDITYPSTVLFEGGENSLPFDSGATIYGLISNYVANVHALGGKVFVSTIMESGSITPAISLETQRCILNGLLLANTAGADGVADSDAVMYNLLGTNYYTNVPTYFRDNVHPSDLGCAILDTNWSQVVVSVLTPDNYFVGYPQQPTIDSFAWANLTGIPSGIADLSSGDGSGLTNLNANNIVGGITSNISIGGHTFYFTNGILMNYQ